MDNKKKMNISLLVLVICFVIFLGAKSKQDKVEEIIDLGFDVPPFAERGPFRVGIRSLKIESEKTLDFTVWYPTLEDGTLNQEIAYPYEIKLGKPLGMVSIASFDGQATQDASYDLSKIPYPLVILSPGFSIGSSAYAWLAEHLASYGLVVISPEHHELLDPETKLWRSAITRPQDILTVLAYVDEQVGSAGIFEGLINPDLVAVIGHSYGGYTTLAAAGAKIDSTGLQSHCQNAIEGEHEAAWICEMLLPHLADMAELAGLDAIPDGLWPAMADPQLCARAYKTLYYRLLAR